MKAKAAISGVRVLERPGRLAIAVCGSLLARLGAEVIRLESGNEPGEAALLCGKHIIRCRSEDDATDTWQKLSTDADVLIAGPAAMPRLSDDGPILCSISASGNYVHPDFDRDAPELLMQALGGLMATSGRADGPPEVVRIPLLEIFTGVDAAVAVLAALRIVEAGGAAQSIDAAVWDTNASLLGTFVAQVTSGKAAGFRDGSRHSICAPWNAYATQDGNVMICTSSDAHWHRMLDIMGLAELRADARFADMGSRRKNIVDVDALVTSWTSGQTVAAVVATLKKNGIPAGVIAVASGASASPIAQPLKLSRTPLRQTDPVVADNSKWLPRAARNCCDGNAAQLPLKTIRVVEIGPFTAGPLTGRSLSDLGAEVIKVEPVKGEVSRYWSPRAGHISGYFANYNVGKKSVVVDLTGEEGRQTLYQLLAGADILVENLKAGALEKLGFGVDAVMNRYPYLIYCSISGYGRAGAQDAALDTVIQAESGIMSKVGQSSVPCKVGFSIADLIAGHLAPLGVIAALRARDHDGIGQHVDVSMLDALHWIMQMGSGSENAEFQDIRCVETAEGWALQAGAQSAAPNKRIKVRDLGEVFADPSLRARGMLRTVPSSAPHTADVMGSPFGLTRTPPRPGEMIGDAGADLGRVLSEWARSSKAQGAAL